MTAPPIRGHRVNRDDAIAHYTARLPDNPSLDSETDAEDRAALAAFVELDNERATAQICLEQLRADIAYAAEWFNKPDVSGVEVFPWLLARAQPAAVESLSCTMCGKDTCGCWDTVEDE